MKSTDSLIIYLIVINLFTSLAYLYDKIMAILHKWRAPENMLMSLALLGGGIGATVGMVVFRHKTRKLKFLVINYMTSFILMSLIFLALFNVK